MIIKIILIQFLLICLSFERRIEESPQQRQQSEENSANFRYNEDLRNESEDQYDFNANKNIRIERSVSVNILGGESFGPGSPAFKVLGKSDAKSLSPKSKRNGTTVPPVRTRKSTIGKSAESAISEFPSDFMTDEFRNKGGFVIHIIIFVYFCLGLAVVCDVYFIESLQFISDALSLPSDIAGATFMAIGTSAPELFTSVIGVFISDNDIGTGTIVGSAVFNLLVIPGCCGFAAYYHLKKMPKISSFPIIRDMIFYVLTIITLILCIKDNKVDWVESVTLLSLYVVYIIIMFFNAQFSHLIVEKNDEEEEEEEETPLLKNGKKASIEEDNNHLEDYSKIELMKTQNGKYKEIKNGSQNNGSNGTPETESNLYPKLYQTNTEKQKLKAPEEVDADWTDTCFMRTILFPFTILFKITLPKPTKFCFVITFMMSIVWIALLTYVVVWMTTVVGYSIGIPDTVSGITILAAGTSVPELISSYLIVKRSGLADMAICNSIGSNIFDILFCLGVPWLLKSLILMITQGTGFSSLSNTSISIQSAALPLTSLTLLITCFALIVAFKLSKWRLGLNVGIICTVCYIGFVIVSTTLEINV